MNKDMSIRNPMVIYMILFSLIMEILGILIMQFVNLPTAGSVTNYTIGILFGLIFSILKLMLMQNSIKKAVTMPEGKAQKYMNVQYMIRYLLTGVVLVVAALEPSISLLGVFIGLISMKIAAYMQIFVNKKNEQSAKH